MPERHLVVDRLKLSYDGLLNVEELHNLIASFFYERNWDWKERVNEELVTPSGKQIRIYFKPWKSVSNYYKIIMHIKLNLIDIKDVDVEHEGQTLRLNQGVVRMTFDGFVLSDRGKHWTETPTGWFLSYIIEKYFYREHFRKFEMWIKSDVDELHNKIKSYLNMFKYTYQQ